MSEITPNELMELEAQNNPSVSKSNLSAGLSCPSMIRNGLLKQDWSECADGTWHNVLYGAATHYTWEEAVYNQLILAR